MLSTGLKTGDRSETPMHVSTHFLSALQCSPRVRRLRWNGNLSKLKETVLETRLFQRSLTATHPYRCSDATRSPKSLRHYFLCVLTLNSRSTRQRERQLPSSTTPKSCVERRPSTTPASICSTHRSAPPG